MEQITFSKKHYGDQYLSMDGDSRMAQRFNELQRKHWVETGRSYVAEELMVLILVEEYNQIKAL